MATSELTIDVRCRNMWLLLWAVQVPSVRLAMWVSRLVRFEYRVAPRGRWRLVATAYEAIDWDRFGDDDGDGGLLIPIALPA